MNSTVSSKITFKGEDVFIIPSMKRGYLLYSPLLSKLYRIDEHLAEKISKDGFSSSDPGIEILANSLNESLGRKLVPFPTPQTVPEYFHMALSLTTDCTLRCLYCHAEGGDTSEKMPKEILDKSIEHAFSTCVENDQKGVRVSLSVGGEATKEWDYLKYCVNQIRIAQNKYGCHAELSLTTNGFYSDDKREFLVNNIDGILLSWDGPEDIQDKHRPTINQGKSSAIVKETAKYFKEKARRFSVRPTVSDYSVARMDEILSYFHSSIGGGYDVVFEPLVILGRAMKFKEVISEPNQKEFIDNYLLAKQKGLEFGIRVKTSAARVNEVFTQFCGAMAIPAFVVTTKGIVTSCERDCCGSSYGYGRYNRGQFIFSPEKIEENKKLSKLEEKCNGCYVKWHCAGDCPEVKKIGYDRCDVNKKLVLCELEQMFD